MGGRGGGGVIDVLDDQTTRGENGAERYERVCLTVYRRVRTNVAACYDGLRWNSVEIAKNSTPPLPIRSTTLSTEYDQPKSIIVQILIWDIVQKTHPQEVEQALWGTAASDCHGPRGWRACSTLFLTYFCPPDEERWQILHDVAIEEKN